MASLAFEDDPKNRVIKVFNAGQPAAWPRAPSNKMSIFEAIQSVGTAKFGALWDGSELDAVYWPQSPKDENAFALAMAARQKRQAAERAASARKASTWAAPRNIETLGSLADLMRFPHDDHVRIWRLEQRQMRWERNREALARLAASTDWLAQRCRDEDLVAFARPRTVGDLYPMFSWEWNIETPLQTIVSDGGGKRYFPQFKQTWEVYVFFDREAVTQAIASLEHASALIAEVDLAQLSPYLRMAVKLALRHGYSSPEGAETAPVREAHIRAEWAKSLPDIPESKTVVEAIAKITGFPNPSAIQQGQLGAQKKKSAGRAGA